MSYDLSLTQDEKGGLVAHHPDCPMVQDHRDRDQPIMTMFGCEGPLPVYGFLKYHECLLK
jgi:hypothetical protein